MLLLAAALALPGAIGKEVSAYSGDLTISTPIYFGDLDGNPLYDTDGVNGILTVDGNLLLDGTGSIHANDDRYKAADPLLGTGASAFPITIVVSGNIVMEPGTVIEARNIRNGGNGGIISITVGGDLSMAATSGSNPGARIDNSAGGASNNNAGASLTLIVGGNMEMGSGSIIKGESVQNGSGTNIRITVGGDLTLRGTSVGPPPVGALISSSVPGGSGGNAGSITINVGDCTTTPPTSAIVVEPGAVIKANSNKGAAGAIVMNACYAMDMDGLVESASGRSGTGATQGPGGGPITLDAGCELIITDDGVVSSRGNDPGADLVHLEACDVVIYGRVESTGSGHAVPNSPKNHLNNTYRPDKPTSSTAGVEVWAGTILIDRTGTHKGEINADLCCGGGTQGTSWIDLFASGDITIIGASSGNFAVHANENMGTGGTGSQGGIVTVKSTTGKITASGLALQANGLGGGGDGGTILVEATLDVDLSSGKLEAKGSTGGTGPHGGTINIRSFNEDIVSDDSSILDVTGNPTPDGVVVLTACLTIGFPPGSVIPAAITPTKNILVCGGAPELPHGFAPDGSALPTYVMLPPCDQCNAIECKWCTKGTVLSQVEQNMGFCCAVPDILVDLRDPSNTVDPDKVGTSEAATGSIQAAVDYINANGDLNGDGYLFIGVTAQDCGTGTVESTDPESPVYPCNGLIGRAPGGHDGPEGYENVVITNRHEERLNVFGCSVDLAAKDPTLPVITIEDSVGKVTVLDIHVWDSQVAGYVVHNNADLVVVKNSRSISAYGTSIGYNITDDDVEITGSPEISGHDIGILVEGSNVKLRTNNDINNNGIGIQIDGDSNESNGNDVGEEGKPNGTGILVNGKDNLLQGDNVIYNTNDGIVIAGSGTSLADGNFVTDEDAQYNGGNGIFVSGDFNTLDGNGQVKFNTGEGIKVTGANNYLNENYAEENGQNGIKASSEDGASNNRLEGNEAKNNVLQGIRACGQIDSGGNTGSGNGVNPQVDFFCAYPDLTISKVDSPDPVAGGANLTYTLTVSNSATATADASGVKVVDTLPEDATFVSASGDHGFLCSYANDEVTCTGGNIPIGESATITIIVKFDSDFCGETVENTAVVDPDDDIIELDEDNNETGIVETTIICADLTISKSAPETIESGAELTYTLTVDNIGAADASGIKVVDTLPTGATYVSASGDHGFSCSEAGGVVTCTGGSINAGDSATITIVVTFDSSFCGDTVRNTAVVDPDDNIVESDEDRNDADVQTKVVCADLDVTLTDNPGGQDLDSTGGYTSNIRYRLQNNDDADIDSVTFTGAFTGTATRSGGSFAISGDSSGWSGTADANGWSCTGPLAAGDSVDITLTVTGPAQGAEGKTVIYTVTPSPVCTGPGPCTDGVASPANSDGSDVTPGPDTDTLTEPQLADLTISKVDSPDPVKAGNNVTYTLTVGNAGNKNTTGVKVVDTLESGATFVSAIGTNGFTCSYASGKVTCTGGSINAGSSATITIKVKFDSEDFFGETVTNTAEVDPDDTIDESNEGNNETEDIETDVISADLDVTLTDSPGGQDLNPVGGYTSNIKYRLYNIDDDADIGSVTFTGTFSGTATRTGASYAFSGDSAGWSCTVTTSGWTCSGPLADGDEVFITFTVTGTGTSGQTIIYTVTPAPVCTDPGPCTDLVDSPANSDHSDVTPGPDTDALS
jgi:uncharacterized repeat protein (TIGR01451 family)